MTEQHTPEGDRKWLDLSRAFREALKLVEPGEYPECLPGEPAACGGGYLEHILATGARIGALALHEASHSGGAAVQQFWDQFDGHRITLDRHHGGTCDCHRPNAAPAQ